MSDEELAQVSVFSSRARGVYEGDHEAVLIVRGTAIIVGDKELADEIARRWNEFPTQDTNDHG